MQQFGTSAFNTVVRWHKLGEVENEYTSEKLVLFAISLPKILAIGLNLTKFWQKNKFAQIFETRCIHADYKSLKFRTCLATEFRKCETANEFRCAAESLTRAKFGTVLATFLIVQESCAIAKMTAQCALYMGAMIMFMTPWLYASHGYYSQHVSCAFVPIDPMNVHTKFQCKISALPVPEIIGGTQKMGSPWLRPRSLFSNIFNGLLFGLAL